MKNTTPAWKRKLSSRKFWLALVGFAAPLLIAFGVSEEMATEITGIIMSGGALIAYIIAEGWTDAAAAGTDETNKEG